jgi:hypothetical protein
MEKPVSLTGSGVSDAGGAFLDERPSRQSAGGSTHTTWNQRANRLTT